MKVVRLAYSRTYQTRPYEPEKFEVAVELDEGEDPYGVMDELKEMVQLMHNPDMDTAHMYRPKKSPLPLPEDPPFFEGGDKEYVPEWRKDDD